MPTTTNILVVDDSKVSRMVISSLIRNRLPQANITEAGDGRSALTMALAALPDLVLLDINMPEMSGIEVAEILRAQAPQVRVALLTANVQDAMRNKAEALGVPLYKKPAKAEIIDQILALLGAA
jgi:CheY-like chemotaxis protein